MWGSKATFLKGKYIAFENVASLMDKQHEEQFLLNNKRYITATGATLYS